MPKGKDQHVVPNKERGGWDVQGENSQRSTQHFDTQKEAIERAKEIAKNQKSEVIIHKKDGTIRDKDSYGNDPNPPKDKKN